MDFKNKDIIVTEYSYKLEILKKLNEVSSLLDVKIISKKDLLSSFYFSYNEESIYYIMQKYNVNLDMAKTYLNNLYYVENKKYNNKKLDNLVTIKKDLIENNLLIFNDSFIKSLNGKRIVFYKYNYFNKLELDMIEKLKNICEVVIIDKTFEKYIPKVYEFDSIFDEIEFVAISILKLIEKGISISDIKLTNVTDEYNDVIDFIFPLYNLKTDINNNYLISNTIANDFLEKEGSLKEKIDYIKFKYDSLVVNQIISICNKYVSFDDIDIIIELITNDFKNTVIRKEKYDNTIEIVDYKNYPSDNKYIFLLSCNVSSIPVTYKDEDYISDDLKDDLLLNTTVEKNKMEKDVTINNILNIKNLVITYKNTTAFETFYPSNIISDLDLEVIKSFKYDEIYSKDYANILLSKDIDNFVSYNVKSDRLLKYNSSLSSLYNTYNNKFKGINNDKLLSYFKDGIYLSYSSINNYYNCGFKYYLKNVLKLDPFEDNFDTLVGKLFHYVIENGLTTDKKSDDLVKEYLKDKELSKKERVLLDNMMGDISFALETLKENMNYTNLKDILFEQNVKIVKNDKVKVTFTGFIDALMHKKVGDKTIAVIVDYKTGNADGSIEYLPYGLSMQLPIYLYLAKNLKSIDNIVLGGFYLEKVLSDKQTIDNKKDVLQKKKDALRLYGYSNSDTDILKEVDTNYNDSKMITGLKTTNDGNFYHYSKVLSSKDMDTIVNIVENNIDGAINNILSGNFDINPKVTDKENLGCKYCEYKDVCYKTNKDEVKIIPDKELSFLGGDQSA